MGTYPNSNGKPNFLQFVSPIGLISRLHHDQPRLKTDFTSKQPVMDPKTGLQIAEYVVSMVWPKALLEAEENFAIPGTPGLLPMRRLAYQAQTEAWPETLDPAKAAWIVMEPFLLDGDNPRDNTERKEFLFGHVWLNFKQKANAEKLPNGQVVYSGAPGLLDAYGNDLPAVNIWAGCTGRVSGIMFGTEFAGKKFISTRLNNVQKYKDGERIAGTSRPDAKSQFDPLMSAPAGMAPMGMPGVGQGLPGIGGQQGYQQFAQQPAPQYPQQVVGAPYGQQQTGNGLPKIV